LIFLLLLHLLLISALAFFNFFTENPSAIFSSLIGQYLSAIISHWSMFISNHLSLAADGTGRGKNAPK
jgi:hypothetical protein